MHARPKTSTNFLSQKKSSFRETHKLWTNSSVQFCKCEFGTLFEEKTSKGRFRSKVKTWKSNKGDDTDFWAELNESYGQQERNVQHFGCRVWYKFRMFHSCAMLFPMTAAAGPPKSLRASGDVASPAQPFKMVRNCWAGISGLELWFRRTIGVLF